MLTLIFNIIMFIIALHIAIFILKYTLFVIFNIFDFLYDLGVIITLLPSIITKKIKRNFDTDVNKDRARFIRVLKGELK